MDAVLWLLSMGVSPSMVQWVVPRDMWCFCREAMSPERFVETSQAFHSACVQVISDEAICLELERLEILCRVHDDEHAPCNSTAVRKNLAEAMAFHGVQVSREELASLRQVKDIVRLGHVVALHAEELELEQGSVPEAAGTLYVDCTSSWIRNAAEPITIFQENKIVPQPIQQICNGVGDFNVCFQASLTAYLEAHYPDCQDWKNNVCTPVKPVDSHMDWLKSQLASASDRRIWQEKRVAQFMVSASPGVYAALRPDKLRKAMRPLDPSKMVAGLSRMIKQGEKPPKTVEFDSDQAQLKDSPSTFSRQPTTTTIDDADALASIDTIDTESGAEGATDIADAEGLEEITYV
jgi:hypothetical protein